MTAGVGIVVIAVCVTLACALVVLVVVALCRSAGRADLARDAALEEAIRKHPANGTRAHQHH